MQQIIPSDIIRKNDKKGAKEMGLSLKNVVKNYGEKVAVEGITFEMRTPGVFGLLRNQWSPEKLLQLE